MACCQSCHSHVYGRLRLVKSFQDTIGIRLHKYCSINRYRAAGYFFPDSELWGQVLPRLPSTAPSTCPVAVREQAYILSPLHDPCIKELRLIRHHLRNYHCQNAIKSGWGPTSTWSRRVIETRIGSSPFLMDLDITVEWINMGEVAVSQLSVFPPVLVSSPQ